MDSLTQRLTQAAAEAGRLESRNAELLQQLHALQAQESELAIRLVASEEQSARLMGLYVATYQLHASLDPNDVRATIAEIAINLLGAEHFVLLLRATPTSECRIALSEGLDDDGAQGLFSEGRYAGSDAMIDASFADGELRLEAMEGSRVLAVVPLAVQQRMVGALVILKLLDHRSALAAADRDLLDLLGAHAASALFSAQVHANADRKLRTLESLVKLAQKGATP